MCSFFNMHWRFGGSISFTHPSPRWYTCFHVSWCSKIGFYSFVLKLQLFTTFVVLLFMFLHLISNLAFVIIHFAILLDDNDTSPLPFCPSLHLPALQYSLCCKAQRTPPPHRSFTPFTPVRALLLGHNRQQGGPLSAWTRHLLEKEECV